MRIDEFEFQDRNGNEIEPTKNQLVVYIKSLHKQIAELKAEIERLKEENADMHTAVNRTIVNTLMIKEDNNRLRTCIDNRIVELQQQLKENTKQVRKEAIKYSVDFIEQHKASYLEIRNYFGTEYVWFNKSNLEKDILDQLENEKKESN